MGDGGARAGAGLAAVVCAVLMVVCGAGPAAAAGVDAGPQSARLAAALRADPVYVTDQLPREVPRSGEPAFAALAKRTGVPTYVLVLPDQSAVRDTLLGTVHDRLGRDGLYVLVDSLGIADARAFGVTAPAQDAQTIALYSLPYDAGPLRAFREFTDAIASGPVQAARRADALEKKYGNTGREVPAFYIDSTGRDNQSSLTGVLVAGAPLTVLFIGLYARRRRHKGRLLPGLPEAAAAFALALAAVLVMPQVFDQSVDGPEPVPAHADMTARLDRVAAGLRHDPVYTDPESPQLLDPARQAELRRRIAAFAPGPVRIAVVPQLSDDESAGDSSAFVTALHARLGPGGRGVYVVADPLSGDIGVYDYGLPLDDARLTLDLPMSLAYDRDTHQADDHRLGARLDQLMTYLTTVPKSEPATGPDQSAQALSDHRLRPLYSGDFWPGLLIGAIAAGLLLGAAAGATGTASAVARRRRRALDAPPAQAPAHPSTHYLARAARREVDALSAEFAAATPEPATRDLVWNCLDTAILLVGAPQAGRADADVPAADLAAATVLAEAGRAALAGHGYAHCCAVNPLHGAAVAPAAGTPGSGRAARSGRSPGSPRRAVDGEPRCAGCRTAAAHGPDALDSRRLFLPGPRGGGTPYEKAAGPLPAVRGGVDRLIAGTREYTHVE